MAFLLASEDGSRGGRGTPGRRAMYQNAIKRRRRTQFGPEQEDAVPQLFVRLILWLLGRKWWACRSCQEFVIFGTMRLKFPNQDFKDRFQCSLPKDYVWSLKQKTTKNKNKERENLERQVQNEA